MENRVKTRESRRAYKKLSISFEKKSLPRAKARAKKRGFKTSFSAYIQKLVDDDLLAAGIAQPEDVASHGPEPDVSQDINSKNDPPGRG